MMTATPFEVTRWLSVGAWLLVVVGTITVLLLPPRNLGTQYQPYTAAHHFAFLCIFVGIVGTLVTALAGCFIHP